jgi:hypothetical protein
MEPLTDAAAVERFAPNWCLFWAERIRQSQFEIWFPYVQRSRYRFVVASLTDDTPDRIRAALAAADNVALIEPMNPGFDWLHEQPGFKGFVYVGTRAGNFTAVNRFGGHAHVFVNHGESGKKSSGGRSASIYDSVFLASYAGVRRFPRSIRWWVWRGALAIGAPMTEGIVKAAPRAGPIRTILYAPTWEGVRDAHDYSSLPVVTDRLVEAMPALAARGVEVLFRPHPGAGTRTAAYMELRQRIVAAGATSRGAKAADFAAADLMISDISGVTAEFLFTENPIAMPVFPALASLGRDRAWFDHEHPWAYHWEPEREDLVDLVERISGSDPLEATRRRASRELFRGHRDLDDAVRTFDLALATMRWRFVPGPLRIPFEVERLVRRMTSS